MLTLFLGHLVFGGIQTPHDIGKATPRILRSHTHILLSSPYLHTHIFGGEDASRDVSDEVGQLLGQLERALVVAVGRRRQQHGTGEGPHRHVESHGIVTVSRSVNANRGRIWSISEHWRSPYVALFPTTYHGRWTIHINLQSLKV